VSPAEVVVRDVQRLHRLVVRPLLGEGIRLPMRTTARSRLPAPRLRPIPAATSCWPISTTTATWISPLRAICWRWGTATARFRRPLRLSPTRPQAAFNTSPPAT
jgi:hypothetical protein